MPLLALKFCGEAGNHSVLQATHSYINTCHNPLPLSFFQASKQTFKPLIVLIILTALLQYFHTFHAVGQPETRPRCKNPVDTDGGVTLPLPHSAPSLDF